MTTDLHVALLPMHITWGDKEKNFETLRQEMANLHPMTDLLILPEMFSTGFQTGDKESIRPLSERNTGETINKLKELAKQYNMGIAGSFIADSGGSLYNRGFLIEPSGEETFADKKHLFTFAGEQKSFSHGYERMHVRFRGWNLAMVICYDIRFPVWCRNVDLEYDILIAVANWPKVRIDAWNKLLPARAIENLAYVCGVDCSGIDDHGFEYDGSSHVIDFKGKEIGQTIENSNAIYATLSKEKLDSFRTKFGAWRDADTFKFIDK